MWEYPFAGENPFNLCAEVIFHLRALNSQLFYSPNDRITIQPPEKLGENIDTLFAHLPTMSDSSKLLRGIPAEEIETLHRWPYYNDFTHLLEFLSRFTLNLPYEKVLKSPYLHSLTHGQDSPEFESLNNNSEETGLLILPLVPTINDTLTPAEEKTSPDGEEGCAKAPVKKHWASDRIPGIQCDLSNIYYVDTEKLKNSTDRYKIKNSVLHRGIFSESETPWKAAVCPIAHEDLLAIQLDATKEKQNIFTVTGLKNQELIYERIKAAFVKAAKQDADIIAFPEMLGDEHILSKAFFQEIAQSLLDFGRPMPKLILLPTWWHDGRNELHVFDGSGTRLCVQQKQHPYVYETPSGVKYKENLSFPERVIHIVHIPEVGRFAFPICRDLLEQEYMDILLRQLRVTFLLSPSYSQHKTQFTMEAISGNRYGCYTIWYNTCAAHWEKAELPENLGLIAGPQTDLTKAFEYMTPMCQGVCGKGAESCIFWVEFSMDHSANISCRHEK